ncbi:hypothetical protein VIN01S_37660 [Vibrio inusitatus NBRC 102082]|uniref:Uncharacterized protein n=1 Tax=Vibrio inusitatus NBRC 102082 TaxID=1219070 RepID=A0A4Y3I295_9VIBR|nr:hypothetical protein VIN01S_37660 [Vibrio inusitatus NBRC 102082]
MAHPNITVDKDNKIIFFIITPLGFQLIETVFQTIYIISKYFNTLHFVGVW